MKKKNQTEQTVDNEKFSTADGYPEGDNYPNCEGSSCDRVADEGEQNTDNSADGEMEAEVISAEAQMQNELAEWKDKYLRLQAEFDNYRRRTLKEKMDLVASGGEDVIKSLLCVIDDLDRAIAAMDSAESVDSIREGVELIRRKFLDVLRGKGVSEIEAVGQPLDTDLHEAVAKFPVEDDRKGLVIDVVQKGYKLNDKVIRYAKVVVGE